MAHAPIVTIQLGQCGNQVGAAFFEQLSQELLEPPPTTPAHSSRSHAAAAAAQSRTVVPPSQRNAFQRQIAAQFFRTARARRGADAEAAASASSGGDATPLPVARAVLVDMEPKVIQQALGVATRSSSFAYDPKRVFYRQSGSGNNWAYGYARHGTECREAIMELVRREVEACSSLGGLMLFSSLAGGTGSGVGAYISECVAEAYPESRLINQVVWPYKHGEVIVQNYNALLTLAHLHEYSDGILLFENDLLHEVCSRRHGLPSPSFADMNRVIARALVALVAPAQLTGAAPFYTSTAESTNPDAMAGTNSSLAKERSRTAKTRPPSDEELLTHRCAAEALACPPMHLWNDAVSHLFAHPSFKLSTVRTVPQVSESSRAFSSSSWRALTKSLGIMGLMGAAASEDGLDHSLASWAQTGLGGLQKSMANSGGGGGKGKMRFHKHYSASARACSLYDPWTMFDAPHVGSPAAVAAASAAAANGTTALPSLIAPSPPAAALLTARLGNVFDAPLSPPPYHAAFRDGESYLECRMLEEEIKERAREGVWAGSPFGDVPATTATTTTQRTANHGRPGTARSVSSDAADDDNVQSYTSSLAQILYLRGSSVCAADATAFLDPSLYAPFALNPLCVARSPVQLRGGAERAATAWTNGQAVVRPLDAMLGKVYKMLHAEAYTHHYRKYGIEVEDMWQQVGSMEQICTDYKSLAYQPRG